MENFSARPTGFPIGGWYALHDHRVLKRPNAQYGDLPPRFKTEDQAINWAIRHFGKLVIKPA